jgi:hypothetical protein
MSKIDYNKFDSFLEVLYISDKRSPVCIGEYFRDTFADDSDDFLAYAAELEALNLAINDQKNTYNYRISPLGRIVYKAGGWLVYNEKIEKDKASELELRIKEVEASVSAAKSAGSAKNAAWASTIIAFFSICISIYFFVQSNEKDKKIEVLSSKLEDLTFKEKSSKKPIFK